MAKKLALYVHVPFCARKCLYCDFLSFPGGEIDIDRYFCALKREIVFSSKKYKDYEIKSVFFGGGTPSLLSVQQISAILETCDKNFKLKNPEITLEYNPTRTNSEHFLFPKHNIYVRPWSLSGNPSW